MKQSSNLFKKLYNNTSGYNWCKVIVAECGEKGANEERWRVAERWITGRVL